LCLAVKYFREKEKKLMNKKKQLFNLFLIIALFLGACNLPSSNQGEEASLTAAAQTVEALLSATPAVTKTITPLPSPATLTPSPCPLLPIHQPQQQHQIAMLLNL
jgi:hypothetical protein